jgi:23S rRNA (adenine2503-C2)-methyltransferase
LGISARRITVSTVGLPRGIARLAVDKTPYHLAISLHAPNDELRNQLVPVNDKTGLPAILTAADEYFRVTHRRLTFEYVLLSGVNDRPEHAQQLVALLRGRPMLLNVIPYNPVAGLPYRTPTPQAIGRFRDILEAGGIAVRFRQRKGARIDAACGQLRRGLPEPVTL